MRLTLQGREPAGQRLGWWPSLLRPQEAGRWLPAVSTGRRGHLDPAQLSGSYDITYGAGGGAGGNPKTPPPPRAGGTRDRPGAAGAERAGRRLPEGLGPLPAREGKLENPPRSWGEHRGGSVPPGGCWRGPQPLPLAAAGLHSLPRGRCLPEAFAAGPGQGGRAPLNRTRCRPLIPPLYEVLGIPTAQTAGCSPAGSPWDFTGGQGPK